MPNRILRDGALDSDKMAAVDEFAELTFYKLLLLADDFGRFDARLPIIRGRAFALRQAVSEHDIEHRLMQLNDTGLIRLYVVGGKPYGEICNFRQRHRAEKSRFPAPLTVMCQTDDRHVSDR